MGGRLPLAPASHAAVTALRWDGHGARKTADVVAEETPVAMVYNGVSHAVMLASPLQLADFGIGFSLTEGIVAALDELHDLRVENGEHGFEVQMGVAPRAFAALRERRRNLAGRTGCGLCGTESLAQAIRPMPPVAPAAPVSARVIAAAFRELNARQYLHALTGAVHAAAWIHRDSGELALVREDVGRHNAVDKLVGALAREARSPVSGFLLATSRASYEIVHKAAAVGISLVAAISAPTALAVRIARSAGVTLVGFARDGCHTVYSHPRGVTHEEGRES
jgi:FdhD protein